MTCKLDRPRVAYIAPTYGQAKRIAWDYAKYYSRPIPGISIHESELRIDYPNGGRLQLLGSENPDSLRGVYLDDVALDEFAFMAPSVWHKVVRPALSDRKGRAVFISSVNGQNEFYHIYGNAIDGDIWSRLMLKASDTGIIPEIEMAGLKRDMPEEDYLQEYECDFTVATKGAYYARLLQQADDDGRITSVPYEAKYPVHTAWDLGIGDSTSIWWFQMVGREIHIIDFYEASGVGLDHYAGEIAKRPWPNTGDCIVPHDAQAKELGTGKSRIEVMQGLGLKCRALPQQPVDDGISAVRSILPKCWFDRNRCRKGIEALRQYRADWDDKRQVLRKNPLHDWTSHAADAFRYLAMGSREDRKPQPIKYPKMRSVA